MRLKASATRGSGGESPLEGLGNRLATGPFLYFPAFDGVAFASVGV